MALRRNLLAAGVPRTAVAGFVAAPPAVASQPSLASPTRTYADSSSWTGVIQRLRRVVAEQGRVLAPDLERRAAGHHGAYTEQVDASCAVMAIRPGTVTRRIEEADRSTR